MTLHKTIMAFATDERGAISVDYVVLSAAAVGMALATVEILTDATDRVGSRMDAEMRTRNLGDDFINFHPADFAPILETGYINQEQAEALFNIADSMMNYDLLNHLEEGIAALEAGTITADELTALVAVASVVHQRNLIDDAILYQYFGFDGSDPAYANGPAGDEMGAG